MVGHLPAEALIRSFVKEFRVTIEVTGDEDKIDSLINLLRGFGVKELTMTGRIAMVRGGTGPVAVEQKSADTRAKKPKA